LVLITQAIKPQRRQMGSAAVCVCAPAGRQGHRCWQWAFSYWFFCRRIVKPPLRLR